MNITIADNASEDAVTPATIFVRRRSLIFRANAMRRLISDAISWFDNVKIIFIL
jgi:hypothetical protein